MVELFEATLSTITQWNKGGAKGALHHSGDGFSLNNDKCFDLRYNPLTLLERTLQSCNMQMRVTNFRDDSIVEKMICKYDISSPVEDTFHHFPFFHQIFIESAHGTKGIGQLGNSLLA